MIIDTIFSIILLKIIQLYHIILLICSILITWIKKLSIRQLIEQIVIIFLKVYGIIISRITQIKSKLHITSPPFVITKIRENTYESNKLVETKCITSRIFNTKLKKYYNSSFRYYTIDKIKQYKTEIKDYVDNIETLGTNQVYEIECQYDGIDEILFTKDLRSVLYRLYEIDEFVSDYDQQSSNIMQLSFNGTKKENKLIKRCEMIKNGMKDELGFGRDDFKQKYIDDGKKIRDFKLHVFLPSGVSVIKLD
jgi:hypothetical protein